jgi:hypothetical protein
MDFLCLSNFFVTSFNKQKMHKKLKPFKEDKKTCKRFINLLKGLIKMLEWNKNSVKLN